MTKRLFLFLIIILAFFGFFSTDYLKSGVNFIAGLFSEVFEEKVSPEELQKEYEKRPIRMMIVPGHDNFSVGGQFGNVRETDLNIELSHHLLKYFRDDKKFHAFITREKDGGYSDWFVEYFEKEKPAVITFRDYLKKAMSFVRNEGDFVDRNIVYHNPAADNVSLNLYAINKVANDYDVDIVLHVHFNDYPRSWHGSPGKYTGFAIYVPEKQLPNSRVSLAVAEFVKEQLEKFFAKSNFPGEAGVIVEDQELIAVGSNASREGVSLLVEYGYIYESQFVNSGPRSVVIKELAYRTYAGVRNYFTESPEGYPIPFSTTLLPHKWELSLKKGMSGLKDIVHLQAALLEEGLYPPDNKTFSSCPMNGNFGPCTFSAVKAFQQKYGISSTGFVGPNTLKKLNELYNI